MRIWPNCASFPFCRMCSCSDSRALFSWPEYVWTTYHFIAIDPRSDVVPVPSIDLPVLASAVDQLRHPRPGGVEDAQKCRGDDGRDDDDDGGLQHLFARRPRHLAQLARHIRRQPEDHLVAPGDDRRRAGDDEGACADDERVRLAAEIAPRPIA